MVGKSAATVTGFYVLRRLLKTMGASQNIASHSGGVYRQIGRETFLQVLQQELTQTDGHIQVLTQAVKVPECSGLYQRLSNKPFQFCPMQYEI